MLLRSVKQASDSFFLNSSSLWFPASQKQSVTFVLRNIATGAHWISTTPLATLTLATPKLLCHRYTRVSGNNIVPNGSPVSSVNGPSELSRFDCFVHGNKFLKRSMFINKHNCGIYSNTHSVICSDRRWAEAGCVLHFSPHPHITLWIVLPLKREFCLLVQLPKTLSRTAAVERWAIQTRFGCSAMKISGRDMMMIRC